MRQCVKIVQIRSYFWSVFSRIWTEYRDLWSKSWQLSTAFMSMAIFNIVFCKNLEQLTLLNVQHKRSFKQKNLSDNGAFIFTTTWFYRSWTIRTCLWETLGIWAILFFTHPNVRKKRLFYALSIFSICAIINVVQKLIGCFR